MLADGAMPLADGRVPREAVLKGFGLRLWRVPGKPSSPVLNFVLRARAAAAGVAWNDIRLDPATMDVARTSQGYFWKLKE
mgnify:CR=1 FL=1